MSPVTLAGGGQGRAAHRHYLCVSGLYKLWLLLPTPAQSCGWFPVWPARDTLLPAPCPVKCLGSGMRIRQRRLSLCPQSGQGLCHCQCRICWSPGKHHYPCLGQCSSLCPWLCVRLDVVESAPAAGSPPSASPGAAQQNVGEGKRKVPLWTLQGHSGSRWGASPPSCWADVLHLTATWTKQLNASFGKQETSATGGGAAWTAGCPCICSLPAMRCCRAEGPGCRSSRKSCCGSHKPGAGQSAAEPPTHTGAHRGEVPEGWGQTSLLEASLTLHTAKCSCVGVCVGRLSLQKREHSKIFTIGKREDKKKSTNTHSHSGGVLVFASLAQELREEGVFRPEAGIPGRECWREVMLEWLLRKQLAGKHSCSHTESSLRDQQRSEMTYSRFGQDSDSRGQRRGQASVLPLFQRPEQETSLGARSQSC